MCAVRVGGERRNETLAKFVQLLGMLNSVPEVKQEYPRWGSLFQSLVRLLHVHFCNTFISVRPVCCYCIRPSILTTLSNSIDIRPLSKQRTHGPVLLPFCYTAASFLLFICVAALINSVALKALYNKHDIARGQYERFQC